MSFQSTFLTHVQRKKVFNQRSVQSSSKSGVGTNIVLPKYLLRPPNDIVKSLPEGSFG